MPFPPTAVAFVRRPWRSATAAWVVAAVALAVGVPPFLRMPPWADVTLYDLAARNVIRGGVHYRDLFDTNLPGMVWAHAAVRTVVGWGYGPLRAADLLVVGLTTATLCRWASRAGAPPFAVAWLAAGVALFYPFTTEFCHVQRDVWMLLPAVLAAGYRAGVFGCEANRSGWATLLEGGLWGAAVWFKPHVVVPAFVVWAVGLRWAASRGAAVRETLGLVAGGAVVGAAGVGWLLASGAWPHFADVFARWNPEYAAQSWKELPDRAGHAFDYFPPWSLLLLAAVPVAVQKRFRSTRPRAVLAGLYLGWTAQALVLQKGLHYVHVPETLLGLAVLAAGGWAPGALVLVVSVGVAATGWSGRFVEPHPAFDRTRLGLWPRCFQPDVTPDLRDRLAYYGTAHCGANWADLAAVERFLRSVEPPLRDRELLCWHDSPHPLYLTLGLEPAVRYMHCGTALAFRSHRDEIAAEVRAAAPRFVVADLARATWVPARAYDPPRDGLPGWLPASQRDLFPWDQPVAFRAGRYVVFRVTRPIRAVDIPAWEDRTQIHTGEN